MSNLNDGNMDFVPVVAKEKTFKVKEVKEAFPGKAVITLSEVKEGESRMLTLSTQAVKVLGLQAKSTRVGIARGYSDTAKTKEAIFLYHTEDESIQFVSENKTAIKIDSAKFSLGTRRAMSVKFHNIISAVHSNPTDSKEKHFLLTKRYGEGFWLLEEYDGNDNQLDLFQERIAKADEVNETSNVGETVDVQVD